MESQAARRPAGRSPFASLKNSQFRWLYISNLAFFFAMMGQFVTRSWLAFEITDSAFALGMVNFAVAVPMLLVAPFGGVIADRVERRNLIVAGQVILLANEAAVLVLLIAGVLAFWHLLAVSFVMGCVFPFIMPARQAIVVNIVGKQGLVNAMALQMGAMNAARVVAPALAGFLIWAVGINWTYVVAIAFYLVALSTMSRVDRFWPEKVALPKSMFADIADGVRYVKGEAAVRTLLLFGLVPILLAMPFQSLLAVFAEDVWDVGSLGLGILNAAAGLGGLIGSGYVAIFGDTDRKLRLMMLSVLLFGSSLFLFAVSPLFVIGILFVLLADVFVGIFQTLNNTIIQVIFPDHVRGRVMSLLMMSFGLTPLGTVPIAALAEVMGAPFAVACASATLIVAAILFYLLSPSLRGIDATSREALEAEDGERLARPFPIAAAGG